jgi:hypothetical protein
LLFGADQAVELLADLVGQALARPLPIDAW